MTINLTLAHGTNARRDRERLIELSNAGTEWQGANRSITGRLGSVQGFGQFSGDDAARVQLRAATYVIYSYATPIAWHTTADGWVISPERYSRTTGRHQSYLYGLTR